MSHAGSHMGLDLPPYDRHALVHTWAFQPGWLLAGLVLLGGYLYLARRAATNGRPLPGWRIGCWVFGVVLLELTLASAIDAYAMALFWMHMVEHLMLIMVVPIFLVLGHPITLIRNALPAERGERFEALVKSRTIGFLTDPLVGLVVYGTVIIATHLTGFMDQMAMHAWLMTFEQILYLIAGYWLLLPLLGHEPLRWDVPYMLRLALVLIAMVPDTVVGLVLLQTNDDPFPVMLGMHPAWAPSPVHDANIAGGLMWAAGDGLMMCIGIAVLVAMISDRDASRRNFGDWLEGARRQTMVDHVNRTDQAGDDQMADDIDPDGDDALAAYNRMLGRLNNE